jgi:hypothetical protein
MLSVSNLRLIDSIVFSFNLTSTNSLRDENCKNLIILSWGLALFAPVLFSVRNTFYEPATRDPKASVK